MYFFLVVTHGIERKDKLSIIGAGDFRDMFSWYWLVIWREGKTAKAPDSKREARGSNPDMTMVEDHLPVKMIALQALT